MPLSPAEIAALEEPRQAHMLAAVALLVRPFAGGVMAFHEPGSWQNQACGVGLNGPVSDEEIDGLVAFYESRGVEARIELSPFAHETLITGLGARGFVIREFENVLARELPAGEDFEATLPFGRAAGLEIGEVDVGDPEAARRSAELTLSGFFPEGEIPEVMIDACVAALRVEGSTTYFVRIEGELAAMGSVCVFGKVASLMGVSTAPRFRRRGIQQALIVERLARARAQGCTLATIGSKPGIPTERNAMRMGFAMAYSKAIVCKPGAFLTPSS